MSEEAQEYDEKFTTLLEAVWGEGFLSPGGTDEVDRYLEGLDLADKVILDIGCGLGGVDIHLIRQHRAAKVTGIDVEAGLIEKCKALADKHEVAESTNFMLVDPGPLNFPDASFDIVTSKDSIIHVADKNALAVEIFRVLKPGGYFVGSDWLAGYEHTPTPEMESYLISEGLEFGLASAKQYQSALELAGFSDIGLVDRNSWYQTRAREEKQLLSDSLFAGLASSVGREFLEHEIEVWDKMIIALDQGQLRPTHLRGRKA